MDNHRSSKPNAKKPAPTGGADFKPLIVSAQSADGQGKDGE
jgi:hypothetical protein